MIYDSPFNIKTNNIKLVLGRIETIYLRETGLSDDGFYYLSKVKVSTVNSLYALVL